MADPSDNNRLTDVARIRRVLARELETINEYEADAAAASHPEVRAFFLHLAFEEKEHVAEATEMLRLLDADQNARFQAPSAPDHYQQATAPRPAPPQAAPRAPAAPSPLINNSGARRPGAEAPSNVPPHRLMYGMPAPPSEGAQPLTVGSLRRSGGGPGEGGGRSGR